MGLPRFAKYAALTPPTYHCDTGTKSAQVSSLSLLNVLNQLESQEAAIKQHHHVIMPAVLGLALGLLKLQPNLPRMQAGARHACLLP